MLSIGPFEFLLLVVGTIGLFLRAYDTHKEFISYRKSGPIVERTWIVVATGKLASTYTINDPGYSNRNTLDSYANSFSEINSYIPSHSDLSYIMFVTNPNINLQLITSSGLVAPTDSFIEDPITNLLNSKKKIDEKDDEKSDFRHWFEDFWKHFKNRDKND